MENKLIKKIYLNRPEVKIEWSFDYVSSYENYLSEIRVNFTEENHVFFNTCSEVSLRALTNLIQIKHSEITLLCPIGMFTVFGATININNKHGKPHQMYDVIDLLFRNTDPTTLYDIRDWNVGYEYLDNKDNKQSNEDAEINDMKNWSYSEPDRPVFETEEE